MRTIKHILDRKSRELAIIEPENRFFKINGGQKT